MAIPLRENPVAENLPRLCNYYQKKKKKEVILENSKSSPCPF